MMTFRGASHVMVGGMEYGADPLGKKDSTANKRWYVLPYTEGKATQDLRDFYRARFSDLDMEGALVFGAFSDGQFIANLRTRAVYRVEGGRMIPTNWRLG